MSLGWFSCLRFGMAWFSVVRGLGVDVVLRLVVMRSCELVFVEFWWWFWYMIVLRLAG